MKNLLAILLFSTAFSFSSYAEFPNSSSVFEFEDQGPELPFENRAACAVDAKFATQSAFLIVDSYNAGKLINSWIQTSDPSAQSMTVEKGLKIFRLSVTEIWTTLIQELLRGHLPIIKQNELQVARVCENRFPCPEMETYLGQIFDTWKQYGKANLPASSDFVMDRSSKHADFARGRKDPQASCLYVKRFSAMQSHWNNDRPDQALLQKIALAALAKDDNFTDCFDDSDDLSSRRFMLQFDLSEVDKSNWKKHGHDFWYSLKLYFSYAWRHQNLILETETPLGGLFANLAVEQMMQVVSNGCRTIERPECSQSQLSMDIFRSIGKMGPTELDKPVPNRPEQALLDQPLAVHRADASVLPDNEDSMVWIKKYQEGIVQKRGLLKQKLMLALTNFELLSKSFTHERIVQELNILRQAMTLNPIAYNKMHALCTEVSVAAHPEFSVLKDRLQGTPQVAKFSHLVDDASTLQLEQMLEFYRKMTLTAFTTCENIRTEKLWTSNSSIANESYASWYRDLSGTLQPAAPGIDTGAPAPMDLVGMGTLFNEIASYQPALVSQQRIDADGVAQNSVVCRDGSDCVRILVKSMVDLYAISSWSDAMMPANEWIQSPNLANPWASATSCKVYDPWFATRKAFVGFVSDLISTTTTGFTGAPAYLAFAPKQRTVTGFESKSQGDDIILKPIKKGAGMDVTLGVDFGPWTGVPCAAVVTPTSSRPLSGSYYTLAGIRAEACTGKNNNRFVVRESSSQGTNEQTAYSGCLMCYLNPYSAVQAAAQFAAMSSPYLRIGVGVVFSGISLAKKLHDPIDVPRRFKVDADEVANTFKKYSFIPKHCVRRLSKGKSCQNAGLTRDEKKEHKAAQATGTIH